MTGVSNIEARLIELEFQFSELNNELLRTCRALKCDIGDGDAIEMVVSALGNLQSSETAKIIELTGETHQIANKMSFSIRARDGERKRLEEMVILVEKLNTISNDLSTINETSSHGKLEEIAVLYQSIRDQCTPRLINAWNNRYNTDLLDTLAGAKKILLQRLIGAMQASLLQLNDNIDDTMGRAFTTLGLFAKIGECKLGVEEIKELVHKFTSHSLSSISNAQSTFDFRFAAKTNKIVDFIGGLIGWSGERSVGLPSFAQALIGSTIYCEAESALVSLTKDFIGEKKIIQVVKETNDLKINVDAREVDLLVAELALIFQNCCVLAKDKYSFSSQFNNDYDSTGLPNFNSSVDLLDEISSYYLSLEKFYIHAGVRLAISMNEISLPTSTCVEDVFFILKKCLTRSIALGEYPVIIEITEKCKSVLLNEFVPFLQKRSRQLHPDQKTGDSITVCLNDVTTSKIFLRKLIDELRGLTDENSFLFSITKLKSFDDPLTELDSHGKSKLVSSFNDLETTDIALDSQSKTFVELIYSTQIRSKLVSFLTRVMRDLLLVDGESALPRVIVFIDNTILPLLEDFIEDNRILMIIIIAREIASHVEKRLYALKWTGKTIGMVERDFRKLSNRLADLSELQSRETLLKVSQMLMILDTETLDEAIALGDALKKDSSRWSLTEGEFRALCTLRSDW